MPAYYATKTHQTQEKTLHRLEDRTLYSLSESNNTSGEIEIDHF